ncbi:hypothetical protein HYC85_028311 [Camellia sinensis]|uniref:Uncharacterized protein n=1 Tax=Camellia sinensis TaxID=4442 RepID=A0A7J7FUU3_CAMSI|nr:hypothetical protein HYC85_028311 [Camellia sinensis]
MIDRPSKRDQVRIVVQNSEPNILQKLIVAPLFIFKTLHELGVQIKSAFNKGIIPKTSKPTTRMFSGNTNASSSTIPKRPEINTVSTVDPFANTSPQTAGPTPAQGRIFTRPYEPNQHTKSPDRKRVSQSP